ncbi:MAG: efflux RND transporter periplasmic adaptor subunit [Planctomycetota bacterium]|nr:efflux RND transporter periplasmic adaptor subunit [Planctomycetota bacterium]
MKAVNEALSAIALLGAMAAAALAQPGGGPPPAQVRVDAVRMDEVEPRREVTGELRASRRSVVAAEEEGIVIEIGVDAGDSVNRGDIIARLDAKLREIDATAAEAEVRRREGQVHEREVDLEQAERDLVRIQDLRERNSASQTELDDQRSTLEATKARLEQANAELATAKAALAMIRQRLEDMVVRAPFNGRVVERFTEVGSWVGVGESVVEVVSYEEIDAWIDVPQQYIGAVSAPDREIEIRIKATGESRMARVTHVVPDADPLSRMFPVRIRLDNPDDKLKPGMSISGLAPTGERTPMLTVHKDAILRDDVGAFVYFDGGGMAAVARIEPLFAIGDRMVVRSGQLRPGAALVVEGNERLFPGQPLTILGTIGSTAKGESGSPAAEG